jgi:hypothetical protein
MTGMVNRWQGNTGKHVRIEEPIRPDSGAPRPPQIHAGNAPPVPRQPVRRVLSELLPADLTDIETDDVILLLILYLMYRESGDSELLIIMGAMFLL